MHAPSQLPERGPTDVDPVPAPYQMSYDDDDITGIHISVENSWRIEQLKNKKKLDGSLVLIIFFSCLILSWTPQWHKDQMWSSRLKKINTDRDWLRKWTVHIFDKDTLHYRVKSNKRSIKIGYSLKPLMISSALDGMFRLVIKTTQIFYFSFVSTQVPTVNNQRWPTSDYAPKYSFTPQYIKTILSTKIYIKIFFYKTCVFILKKNENNLLQFCFASQLHFGLFCLKVRAQEYPRLSG